MERLEHLYLKQLDFNKDLLMDSCFRLQNIIREKYSKLNQTYQDNGKNPLGGKFHLHYNTFLFPYPEFSKLFFQIRDCFKEIRDPGKTYYLQSWLNVFEDNGFFDWHSHSDDQNAWHGYFCVNANNSITQYEFDDGLFISKDISINNKDGLLVIGRCGNDRHRTQREWDQEIPRVTIAFDISPEHGLGHLSNLENHWIPI